MRQLRRWEYRVGRCDSLHRRRGQSPSQAAAAVCGRANHQPGFRGIYAQSSLQLRRQSIGCAPREFERQASVRYSRSTKGWLALIAALCFAVLAGLHAARPLQDSPDPALLGFAYGDICGAGTEASPECPSCVLADSAPVLQDNSTGIRAASWCAAGYTLPDTVLPRRPPHRGYLARGPPLFT